MIENVYTIKNKFYNNNFKPKSPLHSVVHKVVIVVDKKLKKTSRDSRTTYIQKQLLENDWMFWDGKVVRREQTIQSIYERVIAPDLLSLPNELLQHILSFLPVKDLRSVFRLNNLGREQGGLAILSRAKDYGYSGSDQKEARSHLRNLFYDVHTFVKKGIIPKELQVKRKHLFLYKIDREATFKEIVRNPINPGVSGALLFQAIADQSVEKLHLLLMLGAHPNLANEKGKTPLEVLLRLGKNRKISKKKHLEMVRLLIRHGAKINIWNPFSKPPLHQAMDGSKKVIELLLNHKANPNITDVDGFAPLHLAVGRPNVTKLLLEKGAKVDRKTNQGDTALHFAIKEGHVDTVRILLSYGADPSAKNMQGQSPLTLAINKRNSWQLVLEMDSLLRRVKLLEKSYPEGN